MAFPSTLSTFNRPTPTDKLNNPSHSALHNTVSSALGQVEAVIGSSVQAIGTLMYDIRNPASGGGGHVQTAALGGTGITSFTKGDLLVAQSNSVLTKLAVGNDGQVLQALSTQPTGVYWATPPGNKIIATVNQTPLSVNASSATQTIFTGTIPGSTLGATGAIRFTGEIRNLLMQDTLKIVTTYGGTSVGSVLLANLSASVLSGTIEGAIVGRNTDNQSGYFNFNAAVNKINTAGTAPVLHAYSFNDWGPVDSSANQTLAVTFQFGNTSANSVYGGIFLVEKII